MKKAAVAFAMAASLAFIPAATVLLTSGPAAAQAQAQMSKQETDPGLWILDLLIVRPVSLIIVAGAVITYPVALLLDPLFGNDPVKLKKAWLSNNFDYTFDRPLGNFDWKAR